MTERDTPLEDLLTMAAEMLPALTVWPERLLVMMHGQPPLTGIWRNRKVPDAMIGWPIAMHAGATVAGSTHPLECLHRVKAVAKSMEAIGVNIDLTFERAVEATRSIHGIIVPMAPVPADQAGDVQYQDKGFGRFWVPLAQIWRFENPVPLDVGCRTLFYLHGDLQTACIDALRTATRVL